MTNRFILVSLLVVSAAIAAFSQTAAPLSALSRMPIKEITVFKDGHVFVLHEGAMPTDSAGNVLMDYLPAPVLGTFWPYSSDKNVSLNAVVAGQRKVMVERTALDLAEMLEGNRGVEAIITERNNANGKYSAVILGIPERSSQELAATGEPNSAEKLPLKGKIILLRTSEGVKVVAIEAIQDVTFKTPHKSTIAEEEFRNLLTLKLNWAGRKPPQTADVGLVYLQKGIRWIPSYRVTIDGKGNANVKLQATLLNELADVDDITANLVIGVPSFAFKDTLDPISLQKSATQLSQYFQQGDRGQFLSNAISTQTARMTERRAVEPPPSEPVINIPDSGRNEDLFVFTAKHVSLKKGERMVIPVTECTIPYKDVFALDIGFNPPPEVRAHFNDEQQREFARLMAVPKPAHKIRLTNTSSSPLTTAPVVIIRDQKLLAQGMMTYTATGATTDLEITKAVDIQVDRSEAEVKRTPDAVRWQGDAYARIDLGGTLTLTNYRGQPIELEITRLVLGQVDSADLDAQVVKVNMVEDDGYFFGGDYPAWWRWYGWPAWWHHMNGVGRVKWKLNLESGKPLKLAYSWHYFWR